LTIFLINLLNRFRGKKPIRVHIPGPLRHLTKGCPIVETHGLTVDEALLALDNSYPGMNSRLYERGKLRRYIHFYLNGEDIRFLQDKETPVQAGDAIEIVPAMAGGRLPNAFSLFAPSS
jgi:molybdopterin synthase sulfur carrier subunit